MTGSESVQDALYGPLSQRLGVSVSKNNSARVCEGVLMPVEETLHWHVSGLQRGSWSECLYSRNNEAASL